MIVEGFSAGMEVECSVLGNGEPEASVPGEIVLTGSDWYDYEAKYQPGGMELVVARPARPTPCSTRCAGWPATRSCASAAPAWRAWTSSSRTASACSSTSSTRCPGFTATSVYPKLWEASGLPFPALCDRLLALALERFALERSVAF